MALNDRDANDIKTLYYIHRFIPASIARIYAVDDQTVLNIVDRNRNVTMVPDTECLLCGLPDVKSFYIDGDPQNKKPQNILSLCEADFRRLKHLQMKKRRLTSQF